MLVSSATKLTKADIVIPALLIVLSLVPMLGGVMRLMSLSPHVPLSDENARFALAPVPVVVHILSAVPYCLLGAFQFSRGLRLRFPVWHRRAGRVLALLGFLSGATGIWMTLAYDIPTSQQGTILYGVRLMVGLAMILSILIGVRSILQRQVARHEAFMIRAYALGQGAGTQVLTLLPWMLVTGESGGLTRDLLMTLAWVINVGVGEWIIYRRLKLSTPLSKAFVLR